MGDAPPEVFGPLDESSGGGKRKGAEIDERFVDRVDLYGRREGGDGVHHAGAHLPVEGEVWRAELDVVALDEVAVFE